jgi:hypothetical protein
MDPLQLTLSLFAAAATVGYAIWISRRVEEAARVTEYSLAGPIRRARYQVSQQMPLDIAERIAMDLALIPSAPIHERDIHVVADQDEAISRAASLVQEAIDAMRASLAPGWRLLINPALRARGLGSPFLFDAIIEGPPRRPPTVVEAKVLQRDRLGSQHLSMHIYALNERTRQLEAETGQSFNQALLFVVEDPSDAMTVRHLLRVSRSVVEPSNTFVASHNPRSGLDFVSSPPPFVRSSAKESTKAKGLTA